MRLTSICIVISVSYLAGFALQLVSAHAESNALKPRRVTSILTTPAAPQQRRQQQQPLSISPKSRATFRLAGMHKNKELFFFFGISDSTMFKSKLGLNIQPLITNTMQILDNSTQPTTAVNIAFSHAGLTILGIAGDALNDSLFSQGQFANAKNLSDTTENWVPQFKGTNVHGVFLLASDTLDNVNAELANLQSILGSSIIELHRLQGEARPGDQQGHEHFGFKDGISEPAVKGFNDPPLPGQSVLDATQDISCSERRETIIPVLIGPRIALSWLSCKSKQLKQLVPEFNKFLTDNPIAAISSGPVPPEYGSELLGARPVGRWKSGAPLDLAPFADDPMLGNDSHQNNNFTFAGEFETLNQTLCPFSAHIRKTNPRDDLPQVAMDPHHILRSAIPYGPEVSNSEAASNSSSTERGLAFVAYQSDISMGFQFLQQTWANNPDFRVDQTGFDPIIGANNGAPRNVSGTDPLNPSRNITLITDFVVSRGGEYFFSPSLSAILDTLAV